MTFIYPFFNSGRAALDPQTFRRLFLNSRSITIFLRKLKRNPAKTFKLQYATESFLCSTNPFKHINLTHSCQLCNFKLQCTLGIFPVISIIIYECRVFIKLTTPRRKLKCLVYLGTTKMAANVRGLNLCLCTVWLLTSYIIFTT